MIRIDTESRESPAPGPHPARVRAAILWRSGGQAVGQAAMWGSTLLVLRLLSPADYGLFAMTGLVTALAQLLAGYGFAASLVQADALDEERTGRMFGLLIAMNLALAVAQVAAAPLVAAWFAEPRLVAILRVQALVHLATPFIILPQALLAREIDFAAQARANLAGAIAGAAAGPLCALAGMGVWTLVAAPLALFATRAAVLTLAAPPLPRPRLPRRGAGLFGFGGTVFAADLLWFVQSQADVVIAGRRFDPHALGLYAEGLFLAQILVAKFVPALNEVAFPAYARMQADRAGVARGFARALAAIMLVAMPFAAGLAAVAGPVVATVMGERWTGAVPVVRLLALAMPFATLQILYAPVTNALGRPGIAMRTTAAGAILFPIAFLVGARHGAVGMAAAWLVAAPLLAGIASALSLGAIGLGARDLVRALLPPAVAAGAMGLAVAAADRALSAIAPVARLALLVPLGVALYAGLALIVARPAVRDAIAMVRGRG